MKGFSPEWCELVASYVQGGSVGVKVNDDIGHYFQTRKRLRQDDPLSPILFNIVADMLAILIARAKEDGQVGDLVPHLVEGESLFYNMLMTHSFSWNTIWRKPST
jgi:hypothetical protein